MKVLFLGPYVGPDASPILEWLQWNEDVIWRSDDKPAFLHPSVFGEAEFVVSHRYTHKIPDFIINRWPQRIINIHSGLLPQNKGVHPVFWAWLKGWAQGGTIHRVTKHIDCGPILATTPTCLFGHGVTWTFRNTWELVERACTELFIRLWPDIKCGRIEPEAQDLVGYYHSLADFREIAPQVLTKGWDTPVLEAKRIYDAIKTQHSDRI